MSIEEGRQQETVTNTGLLEEQEVQENTFDKLPEVPVEAEPIKKERLATWKVVGISVACTVLFFSVAFLGFGVAVNSESSQTKSVTSTAKTAEKKAETKVDKNAMSAAIQKNQTTFDSAKYTPASFDALKKAIDSAKTIEKKSGATQAEVDNAIKGMEAAVKGLVEGEGNPAPAKKTAPKTEEDKPAQKAETPAPAKPTATASQKNAVKKAKSYLDYSAFSYTGLIGQLEYEKFSTEDATYAADNCGADWNRQAEKKAKSYLEYSSFSHDGLVEQLIYEGFTPEQATHGADSTGL